MKDFLKLKKIQGRTDLGCHIQNCIPSVQKLLVLLDVLVQWP